MRSWTNATTTSTDHYGDDNDSPSWTAAGSSYTRYIDGPDSLLAMTYDSNTGELATRLGDLHGNIIGIITGATPEIQATYETDEYGVPHDPADIGDVRYGYLGQHQRATDNPAGISLMGVRLYNAGTGRFLTVDPVLGGNSNPYEYCNADPSNCADLSGQISSPLNKMERSRCSAHKLECFKNVYWSVWATSNAKITYPNSRGKRNAYRHCIWQAMLSYQFGSKAASAWATAHENGSVDAQSVIDYQINPYGRAVGTWARNQYPVIVRLAKNYICNRCIQLINDGYLNLKGDG